MKRERISAFMRRVMHWKVVFDLLTMVLVGLLLADYFAELNTGTIETLSSYWFWLLTVFAGMREVGRWVSDHESGHYVLRHFTHGEIYVITFICLPFILGVPQAFLETEVGEHQKQVMVISTSLGLKVALLFAVTSISKHSSMHNKKVVEKLSGFLDTFFGSKPK